MTELKCPFCGKELEKNCDWVYGCPNRKCKAFGYFFGARELWQELIRTRKALDVAVDALKEIKDGKIPVSLGICMDINDALEQIKEQQ